MAKRHMVRVSGPLARKVGKVIQELSDLGLNVRIVRDNPPGQFIASDTSSEQHVKKSDTQYFHLFRFPWENLEHAVLVFGILKGAYHALPKIRKVLADAGVTDDEIITLDLFSAIRRPKKTKKKTAKTKK